MPLEDYDELVQRRFRHEKALGTWQAVMLAACALLALAVLLRPAAAPGVETERGGAQPRFEYQGADGRIDINRADAAALELLPGIGPARARDILEYREKYGGFGGEYELLAIPGFSLELVEGLIDYICVEDSQ